MCLYYEIGPLRYIVQIYKYIPGINVIGRVIAVWRVIV